MKVQDLVMVLVAVVVLVLHFTILGKWDEIRGVISTLLVLVSIFWFLFLAAYGVRYYLMNSEVGTLLETLWFQKAVIFYGVFIILLRVFVSF